ncbi:MAG: hypothetical protein IPP46_17575 [Bacteroidetes bacterium]|nr:hypothetical protein [Bacteroidota bacterium]
MKIVGLHLDLNLRNYEFLHDLEQGLIRGSIYYNLPAQKLQLSAGQHGAMWNNIKKKTNQRLRRKNGDCISSCN